MKYCTIYLVRHGETEWNVTDIVQGHADSFLTKKGEEQARELTKKFRKIHFDAVFSSDLLRARRTAKIIILERRLAIKTTKLLRERKFGQYEGKHVSVYKKELQHLLEKLDKLPDKERKRFKLASDIESDEEMFTRFNIFLRETSVAYLGKTILVVTHGGIIRIFLIHLGYGNYKELPAGSIKNTAFIKLLSDGTDYFIDEVFGVTLHSWSGIGR